MSVEVCRRLNTSWGGTFHVERFVILAHLIISFKIAYDSMEVADRAGVSVLSSKLLLCLEARPFTRCRLGGRLIRGNEVPRHNTPRPDRRGRLSLRESGYSTVTDLARFLG